jgi:predicted NBD/HSP70 family sugar kinase
MDFYESQGLSVAIGSKGEPVYVATVTDLPIFIENDVAPAAGAEVIFGAARHRGDFAYLFLGRASECRLVLDHRVYAGSPRSL